MNSLRPKILLSYVLILGLLVLTLGWSLYNLSRVSQASDAILQENYRSILAANNMIVALERQDSSVLTFVVNQDSTAVAEFRANEIDFLHWLSRAQDNVTIETEPEILENIEQNYLVFLEKFTTLRTQSDTDRELFYFEEVYPTFQSTRFAIEGLREVNQTAMVATSNQAKLIGQRAIGSTLLFGLTVWGVGIAASWLLAKRLADPLRQMYEATVQIAEGNYDVELSIDSQDELGQLARQINVMSRKLRSFHEMNVWQLVAAKQRNEAIIQNITDGIIVVDEKYEISSLNPRAAQILNADMSTAVGQHFLMALDDRLLFRRIQEAVDNAITPHLTPEEKTVEIKRDGETYYYLGTITPVMVNPRKMIGVVVVLHDITEFKRLDQLKSEFIMTASHELRTPLTGLNMSIELLMERLKEHLDPATAELLNAAREDGQHLRVLIQDLLDLSKLETGQTKFEFRPVLLSDIVHQGRNLFDARATEEGKNIRWEGPEEPLRVLADSSKLLRVVCNLVENALLYTEPNSAIKVTFGRYEEDKEMAHIAVIDDGAGISPEEQSAIFDKFVQGSQSHVTSGSGLGLAISKEIVQMHGGQIWVTSQPGEETAFQFTIPLVTAHAASTTN